MPVRPFARLTPRARLLRRRTGDAGVLAAMVALAVLLTAVSVHWPRGLPLPTGLSVPLLLGGLLLPGWVTRTLIAVAAGLVLVAAVALWPRAAAQPPAASMVTLGAAAVVAGELARRRERLGARDSRPDVILLELRDRLGVQGELPVLPAGWCAEAELRPAHGAGFAGDFVVGSLLDGGPGRWLELALVDVSGKGAGAGTRALLLSGAMGGLLGAVPAARFLPEANRYLMRQRWGGGFASAVHLRLDLDTGEYRLASAGHPPVAHYGAGSGTWRMSRSSGPLLGVRPDVSFQPDGGRLHPGDALLLYTDGVVEGAGRDVDTGIDRLLGQAERLVPAGGFGGATRALLDSMALRADDDRALVLLWRDR
ncbi:MAG TPA: PP2C family protein-serine/threonine phosphatase [Mycobacteriales bacterium]|nr:PP2C family protein-serine/threonine phosphatase [Mycobacteriales bacterium]